MVTEYGTKGGRLDFHLKYEWWDGPGKVLSSLVDGCWEWQPVQYSFAADNRTVISYSRASYKASSVE